MLQSPTIRKPSENVGVPSDPNRLKKLFAAMVILFATLLVVLVRDTQLWFTSNPPETADTWTGPQESSTIVTRPAPVESAATVKKHVAATPTPVKAETPAVVATNRAPLPPLNIEVVSDKPRTIELNSDASPKPGMAASPAPLKLQNVSQRTTTSTTAVPAPEQTVVAELPLLARQMKVQGSVLMQALIAADGAIKELRVISGPAVLAAAARQAVLQYRFKPYLQNGQPVETSARVTVNFAIKVLDDASKRNLGGEASGEY
jgi:TonB family protein